MQAIHESYVKRPFPRIHFRLKDTQVRRLQYFLTQYFGRPNSFDVGADASPRSGTYLCAACFYMHGGVTAMERAEGQRFENGPTCRGANWILRGRRRWPQASNVHCDCLTCAQRTQASVPIRTHSPGLSSLGRVVSEVLSLASSSGRRRARKRERTPVKRARVRPPAVDLWVSAIHRG
jgi:hypothetical protein